MTKILATERGKETAITAFVKRAKHPPNQIDNGSLLVGSSMYYYCRTCGHLSDTLPEGWWSTRPNKTCEECEALKTEGWLAEAIKEAGI